MADILKSLSDMQVINGPADVLSGDILDLGVARELRYPTLHVNVSEVSGADVVLLVELLAADSADLSVGFSRLATTELHLAPGMIPQSARVVSYLYTLAPRRRFVRCRYTLSGSTPSATVSTVLELATEQV